MLIHMVNVIEPGATWPTRLFQCIQTLDPQYHPLMGFPDDWRNRPYWKSLAAL